MKRLSCLVLLAFFTCCVKLQAAPVALFYLINQPNSIRSFVDHADKVDLLVPMWYSTDANGLVSGGPEPLVMRTAKEHHVPVMPIITIENKDSFHSFLTHAATHKVMIDSLIQQCKLNGYTGIQFDFEDISWTDRDNLSALVKETATALHKEGLQLTIATVPNAPGYPGAGGFAKWIWQDWRGAYDLEALAKSVDLILPDDLRPAHTLDFSWASRWLGLDGREYEVRSPIYSKRKTLSRNCSLRLPLVHDSTNQG